MNRRIFVSLGPVTRVILLRQHPRTMADSFQLLCHVDYPPAVANPLADEEEEHTFHLWTNLSDLEPLLDSSNPFRAFDTRMRVWLE